MSVLEREIIEKFQRLEPSAKERVLQTLVDTAHSSFDYETWWKAVDALQADIRSRIGNAETVGALSLLDELREEAS